MSDENVTIGILGLGKIGKNVADLAISFGFLFSFIRFFNWLVGREIMPRPASGDIVLGFGQHEIKIEMDGTPCRVTLSLREPCHSRPVCHGDVNKIGFTIMDNGFVLYADIKTNTCCIEWHCDLN